MRSYISAGTYTIKISAYEKVTGKYSVDFTFTPFYESFSETEAGSNNTLETANNAETETIYSGLLTETDKVDIFKYSFDKKAMLAVLATSHMDSVNVYLLNEKGGTCYVAYVSANNSTGSYEIDTTKAVFGDFNSDGKIDVNDATILQMSISGGHKLSDLKVLSADLDGDGLIMITDVTYLQMKIAESADSM